VTLAPPDLLVVGAGPAGSALAIRSAREGLRTVLVDRARFPRDKPCAEYLSPETLRQLDILGVLPAVDAAGGATLRGTTVTGPRGARLTGLFDRTTPLPFRATGLGVARRTLDHLLVRAAQEAGAHLLEEHAVTELLYAGGGVSGALVRGPDGRLSPIRARLTVGADGLRSVVARRLGARFHGRPARIAFVCHAGVSDLTDQAELHVSARGYVGLNPLGGGLGNVALVVPANAAGPARGRPQAFFFEQLERFPGVRGRVSPERVERPVMVTGPFSVRARRVTAGGALLVGDAADFFDPFTGEGIWAALQGAAFAADTALDALAAPGPVTARRLAAYPARRRARFAGKWIVERAIGFGMFLPTLFDRSVERIERGGWSHTLIGVTGDQVPARALLSPRFLWNLIR